MANVEEMRRRLERETEAGLRARLKEAESVIEQLHQALFTEVRERFANVQLSEDDLWSYIADEHGIARVGEGK